jgi:TRAP-type C4-dicarboxylate transport system substrate-binding protein
MRGLLGLAAAALFALLPVACSTGSDGDKAGGDAPPVTLRMATIEGTGAPYADGVREFARQVNELSEGSLRVEIIWEAPVEFFGEHGPGADQKVARLVQDGGRLDLGLIPARAWDVLGVTSLQALHAPFLVSTEELLEDVVQSDAAKEMLAGLDKAEVEGLALLPEGLRHPLGFERPFLTLEDFAGAALRAPRSKVSDQLFEALGARAVDIWGDELAAAFGAGEIAGAESGYAWGNQMPTLGIFTANMTFFPKVNVLVANADAFDHLSGEHQKILRDGAAESLRYVVENAPTERERAERFCGSGGAIAFASGDEVAAVEQAAQPVYAELHDNARTKALINRIRTMKARTRASDWRRPTACKPRPRDSRPASESSATPPFPEGVYRADLPPEHLISKGMDSQTAYELGGLGTLTIEDGRWRHQIRGNPEICGGLYSVDGGRISLRHVVAQCGSAAGHVVFDARWKLRDDELLFYDFRAGRPIEWGSKPWRKID